MSLTSQEKKELNYNNLSQGLKRKIDAAFESQYFNTTLALFSQIYASQQELIDTPFTIRGVIEQSIGEDGVISASDVKDAIKEAVTARANTETALKVSKWLIEATDDLEILQNKLSPEENRQIVKKVTTATDLKKEAFGKEKDS